MTENIEPLILEQFRALRNRIMSLQTEMHNEFNDVKHRMSSLTPPPRHDRTRDPPAWRVFCTIRRTWQMCGTKKNGLDASASRPLFYLVGARGFEPPTT